MGQAWTLDLEVAFYIVIPLAALMFLAVKRSMRDDAAATPDDRPDACCSRRMQ